MQIDEKRAKDANYINGLRLRRDEIKMHLDDLNDLLECSIDEFYIDAIEDAINTLTSDAKQINEFLFWFGGDYTKIRNDIYRDILKEFKKKVN